MWVHAGVLTRVVPQRRLGGLAGQNQTIVLFAGSSAAGRPRRGGMERRVEATTVEGFVQQLAVAYVAPGVLLLCHGIRPRRARTRRGSTPSSAPATGWGYRSGPGPGAGPPGRRATPTSGSGGSSCSWPLTARARSSPRRRGSVRDARRTPIRFSGYAISHRGGHVHVRIDRPVYLGLKAYLVGIAAAQGRVRPGGRGPEGARLRAVAPVRSQCRAILRAVNRARAAAGLPEVPRSCLRTRRRVVRPFGPPGGGHND